MTRHYLTPQSPTGATTLYLGETLDEAARTLSECGYPTSDVDHLMDGRAVESGGETWTLTTDIEED